MNYQTERRVRERLGRSFSIPLDDAVALMSDGVDIEAISDRIDGYSIISIFEEPEPPDE